MKRDGRDGDKVRILGLFARYFFIFLLGLGNLAVFYAVLTPVTVGVLSAVLSLSRQVIVEGTFIMWGHITISVVPACVAGAAFYLMFLLVFSTPDIVPKKRVKIFSLAVIALFVLNVLRILLLILLIGQSFFDVVHWLLWNVVSTLFVVFIWLVLAKRYEIKAIPVYSDLKYLYSLVRP